MKAYVVLTYDTYIEAGETIKTFSATRVHGVFLTNLGALTAISRYKATYFAKTKVLPQEPSIVKKGLKGDIVIDCVDDVCTKYTVTVPKIPKPSATPKYK